MSLYKEAIENAHEYKDLTWEDIKELLTKEEQEYWNWWDKWWAVQSPAFQEEFDRIMRERVKKYCDESKIK